MQNRQYQELLDKYLTQYSTEKNLRPNTVKNKTQVMARLTRFLDGRPFELEHVKLYIADLYTRGVQPNSVRTVQKNIKAFCKWLVREGYLDVDWSLRLETPKVHQKAEQLVSAELAEQIIIAGTQPVNHKLHNRQRDLMRLAMRLSLRSGLRDCELKALGGQDLHLYDDEPRMLVHSKGGSLDWQPIPHDLVEELKSRLNEERVFPVAGDRMNDALTRGSKALGVPRIHLHQLRKIYGCTLARNGLPIAKVCQLMRHKDISTTVKFYIKFGINELSQDQNYYHSLTRLGLPSENMMDIVASAVEKTGVTKNSNLMYEINRSSGEMVIRIRNV